MVPVRVRSLRADDVDTVRSIEVAAGERFRDVGMPEIADDEPPGPAELLDAAAAGRAWVAVDESDRPVGYVLVDDVDGAVHIEQVSVHPEHQGRGVGRLLIDHVAWDPARGWRTVTLTTFRDVEWNAPLYERLGFRVLEEHEVTGELRDVRAKEAAAGLDPELRVCMRRVPTPPAPVELVIFDCDGVLVDSERLSVRVESQLLGELGWAISEHEVMERFVGRSDAHMLSVIEEELGRPVPEFMDAYRTRLFAAFDRELDAVPGVADALDRIDSLALSTCVASSGTHEKMARTLGRTGLFDRFDGRIFSATEVERGKPAPDLFLFAAASMGVAPDRCLVVEDSRYGVQAARAAGMRSVGFAGGLTPAEWLAGPGTIVVDDMADLPDLLAPR